MLSRTLRRHLFAFAVTCLKSLKYSCADKTEICFLKYVYKDERILKYIYNQGFKKNSKSITLAPTELHGKTSNTNRKLFQKEVRNILEVSHSPLSVI